MPLQIATIVTVLRQLTLVWKLGVIRRSGSRNCSPSCRYRCVVRLAAQFKGWIGPCLFPPQTLSALTERVRYSDTDANNDDHDTGPMHGNKEETMI